MSSYSIVSAHLLKAESHGIHACTKVTIDILNALRSEVAMAQAALAQNKPKNVSLPSGSASVASSSASTKKRRGDGPSTALEKAWLNDLRKQLDEKIARAFYSGGMQNYASMQQMYCTTMYFISCILLITYFVVLYFCRVSFQLCKKSSLSRLI